MSTQKYNRISVYIIGQAASSTITCKCASCQESYIMTCEDYAFNLGAIIKEPNGCGPDSWICPDCVEEILRIKNIK